MALSTDPIKRDCQLIRYKAIKSGMSEDEYKEWLQIQFQVSSSTELSAAARKKAHGRLNVLLEASGHGRAKEGAWRDPQIQKLMALWHALADADAVRVRTREAMEAWCKRQQPKMSALRFASGPQLQHLVEALKQWAVRVGVEVDA